MLIARIVARDMRGNGAGSHAGDHVVGYPDAGRAGWLRLLAGARLSWRREKTLRFRGAFFRDQHDGIEISMKTVQHRVHGLFSAGGLPACADGQPDEVNVAG